MPPSASGIEPQLAGREGRAEQHHGDGRDGIRLEEVGGHAGAVADVVTHVVGDHGRVPRVVLGDPSLDLADEVGADVRGLREDAAAETREDRDERAAEREPDQVVDGRLRAVADPVREDPVVAGDAEQAEAHDEQPRHRAGTERDLERGRDALAGCLRRPDVGPHRDVHADEAGGGREERTDRESDRRAPPELRVEADREQRHDGYERDRRVLLLEIGGGALLHGTRDRLHPLVPGRLLEQPPGQIEAESDRDA